MRSYSPTTMSSPCSFWLVGLLYSYDFNQGVNYDEIMKSYLHMGYQGTNLGEAIEEVKRMVRA